MKFTLYIAICASLIIYWHASIADPKLETLGDGYIQIFSTNQVSHRYIISQTSLGFAHSYRIRTEHVDVVRPLFREIDGESLTLTNTSKRTVLAKLSHYRVVSTQTLGDLRITNLYSNRAHSFVRDGRNRINLQVAERGGVVTVGWPLILGWF